MIPRSGADPPASSWLLPTLLGSFLAGALYALIAGSELRALPWWALLAAELLAGLLAAAPFAAIALYRRWRGRQTETVEPARAAALGFINAAGLLVGVESLVFGIIRGLFRTVGLVEASPAWILTGILGGILAAFLLIRLGEAGIRRVTLPAIPSRRLFLGVLVFLPCAAILGSLFRDRPPTTLAPIPIPASRPAPRLVVVGIDGLGENVFRRFSDSMPNLSRFRDSASTGLVASSPPFLSAAIWTSISTGLPWREHGVTNFEIYREDPSMGSVPIDTLYTDPVPGLLMLPGWALWKLGYLSLLPPTHFHRRGTPLWMEKAAGRVAVVCWPATWPAEPVPGALVTDRWPPDKAEVLYHSRLDMPDLVYPPELLEKLAPLRRKAGEPPDPELLHLAPLTAEEEGQFVWGTHWTGKVPKNEPLSNPYYGWLGDRSCLAAAKAVETDLHPDLLAVYLLGADLTEHTMMPDEQGRIPGFDESSSERLKPFMPGYLAALDREVAWLFELGDASTTTVFLADHGMSRQPNSLFNNWHSGPGLIFARGPGLPPGGKLGSLPPEEIRPLLMRVLSGSPPPSL